MYTSTEEILSEVVCLLLEVINHCPEIVVRIPNTDWKEVESFKGSLGPRDREATIYIKSNDYSRIQSKGMLSL